MIPVRIRDGTAVLFLFGKRIDGKPHSVFA